MSAATRGNKTFGHSTTRLEDPDLLRGKACFVGDIRLPGMLHAAFVRSPHAHAKIVSIDTSRALALPGVVTVLTATISALRSGQIVSPSLSPIELINSSATALFS